MTFFAFVLSALLIYSSSAQAEVPSPKAQLGLEILITVFVAAADCEKVQLDASRIESVIGSYGIVQSDLREKYRDFSVAYMSDLMQAANTAPIRFCVYALGTFGPQGSIPGLIARR